ncbi:terminase gpA endonuclease subunit [Klebsiella pneumoniae]|nr:terminase gpA endonuclease subunit [Klebsiella pneumoniae]MDU3466146.1 terminase gpA endonuclease subunit [Klebsiella oxytoca]MBK5810556.1 phage terminase large subunit family protein [Klebsiella pneumoniae]MBM1147167.1 phage terminase large subunit family protein [Klebsiella pneumoniae]MBS3708256.1 phage terminase large subunit family protein [Klebsiella pneumoniae]MCH1776706.1 phage terminase large subunit family protein [Klebsiella pneumoniae]
MMKILNKSLKAILPPKKIKPSEWVKTNTVFPDGVLQYQPTTLFKFQEEPLDATVNPKIRKICLMSSAQLLKTTILQNGMLYRMSVNPTNQIFATSSGGMLKKFRQGKWQQVIEKCPNLKALVTDKNDKNSVNDMSTQQNKDGTLTYFLNMGSPASLRTLTVPVVWVDELSGVDPDGEEGNPLQILENRTASFPQGLIVMASTPLHPDDMISQQWQLSNQQKFFIPCPHCEHEHELVWENVKFDWKPFNERRNVPVPESATLHCPKCDEVITEAQRIRAVNQGRWIATNPEVEDYYGYHISRLYSPNSSIRKIVQDFAEAWLNYDEASFYNNTLGLPWEDKSNIQPDLTMLENLRDYTFDVMNFPEKAIGCVLACDQQLDRLEVSTLAFDEKNVWLVDHRYFRGVDCTKAEDKAYAELVAYSNSKFTTPLGKRVKVLRCFIDSSNGGATKQVYKFCNTNRNWTPIKGKSVTTGAFTNDSREAGHELVNINVHEGKNTVRKLLLQALNEPGIEKAMNVHFSHSLPDDYFLQLTAEKLNKQRRWELRVEGSRNEALDCIVYGLAAIDHKVNAMGAQPYKQLRIHDHRQKELAAEKPKYKEEEILNKPTTPTKKKSSPKKKGISQLRKGGWF